MSGTRQNARPFPFGRAVAASLGACAAGFAAGAVFGAIGRFIYLPLITPGLAAAAAGAAAMMALRWSRAPGIATARTAGTLAATAALAGLLLVTQALFRADLIASLTAKGGSSDAALEVAVDTALAERGGGGVFGSVTLRVQSGTVIVGETAVELGRTGNAVVLGLEWALTVAVAVAFTSRQGQRPFSFRRQAWLTRQLIGHAAEGSAPSIIGELEKREYHRVGRRLEARPEQRPGVRSVSPPGQDGVALWAWTEDGWTPGRVPASPEPVWLEVVAGGSGERASVVHRCVVSEDDLSAICESVKVRVDA